MKTVCLLDPGVEDNKGSFSSNLGDLIIQEAVNRELHDLFKNYEISRISTHSYMDKKHSSLLSGSAAIFVGGTNLLSSEMHKYRQWKISLFDAFKINNAILLGVGWWQYQKSPNLYTKILLKAALAKNVLHSVRDSYTKSKLESIGLKNVINTSCPTLWPLAQIKPGEIPSEKSENVLLMLTDYAKDIEADRRLVQLLFKHYKKVFVWPQGRQDHDYILGMNMPFVVLDHTLEDLDNLLQSDINLDYIGTRLHGGIRCLKHRKRSLIIEIDNRAHEISRDTGLPTVGRNNFKQMEHWIENPSIVNIKLDLDAINKWKNQFRHNLTKENNSSAVGNVPPKASSERLIT